MDIQSEAKPKRKHRRLTRILAVPLVIAIIITIGAVAISNNMRPVIAALATAKIKSITAAAMNTAILESLGDEETYAKLIEVYRNDDKVLMLQANARIMNLLAADCAEAALKKIAALGEQGVEVPFGTVTGFSFLSGAGPKLRVTFTPAGSVQSAFTSEFISTGINQSLYRVKLTLSANVKLVMSGVTETISLSAQAAIAENVIVGEVPQVYTDVASEEDMLNLIPTELP